MSKVKGFCCLKVTLASVDSQPRPQGAFPLPPPKLGKSALGTKLVD